MRFLLDECLAPSMAALLRAAGHDCAHVYELGLRGQPDDQVTTTPRLGGLGREPR
jgi:predicted nuclease of predicted toxin-antitoxin system